MLFVHPFLSVLFMWEKFACKRCAYGWSSADYIYQDISTQHMHNLDPPKPPWLSVFPLAKSGKAIHAVGSSHCDRLNIFF